MEVWPVACATGGQVVRRSGRALASSGIQSSPPCGELMVSLSVIGCARHLRFASECDLQESESLLFWGQWAFPEPINQRLLLSLLTRVSRW